MELLVTKWLFISFGLTLVLVDVNGSTGISQMMSILISVNDTTNTIASVLPQMASSISVLTNNQIQMANEHNKTATILSQVVNSQDKMATTQAQIANEENQTSRIISQLSSTLDIVVRSQAEMATTQAQIVSTLDQVVNMLQGAAITTEPSIPDVTDFTNVETTDYNTAGAAVTTEPSIPDVTDFTNVETTDYNTAGPSPCASDEFRCSDGFCVWKAWTCDGVPDCGDGSDEEEQFCSTCPFKFYCSNGKCVDLDKICDGNNQCRDNSDEDQVCVELPSPTFVDVGNHSVTVTIDQSPPALGSGRQRNITEYAVIFTPQDWSDPITTYISPEAGSEATVTGLSSETVYDVVMAAVINTAGQGEQTYNLQFTPLSIGPQPCASDEFRCSDGFCVLKIWACDGISDCADESDEEEQFCSTCPFKFYCSNGRCVDLDRICDGNNQCRDNSDEDQVCVVLPSPTFVDVGDHSVTVRIDQSPPALGNGRQRNITEYAVIFTPQDGADPITTYISPEAGSGATVTGLSLATVYDVVMAAVINTAGQGEQTYNLQFTPLSIETGPACPQREFKCGDALCIPEDWACDGFADCDKATDEDAAFCATCPFKFFCSNGGCTELADLCDGVDHCKDNSDEDQICSIVLPVPLFIDIGDKSVNIVFEESPPQLFGEPMRTIKRYLITLTPQNGDALIQKYVSGEAGSTKSVIHLTPKTTYDVLVQPIIDTAEQGEQIYDVGSVSGTFVTLAELTPAEK